MNIKNRLQSPINLWDKFCKGVIITILNFFPIFAIANISEISKQFNFISTDYVEYLQKEQLIYAKGNIQIILDDYFLTADNLIYDLAQDKLWAEGNVMIKDKYGKIILGEIVILKNKLKTGIISDFIFYFGDNALLISKLAARVEEKVFELKDSTFTPCKILCNNKPIWQISAKNATLDFKNDKIVYNHLFFEVWGVPVLFTPYFSHPTPKAKAKSGILVPKILNKGLGIPLYYRAMPNLDFTLTPRIFPKYNIFELEVRYKLNQTDYLSLDGSYGKVPSKIIKEDIILKNHNIYSYYVSSNGNFKNGNYNYGFKIERTSDKAYLKNYYQKYPSYLTSKIYLHNVDHYNYFLMEGTKFKGLNANDSSLTDPLIFPRLQFKNVINLNEQETSKLIVENTTMIYREKSGKNLASMGTTLVLDNNFLTTTGHLFRFIILNRADIYFLNHLYPNNILVGKVLKRNIPEIQTIWRYPMANLTPESYTLLVEPIILLTIGRKDNYSKKFTFIDNFRYELSENNIFLSNHYSGMDKHEFGNRLSYGVNTVVSTNSSYYHLFLGQTYNNNFYQDSTYHTENIGKISGKFTDNIEVFYRFRKSQSFKPIRDEVGSNIELGKLHLITSFAQIKNLKKYGLIDTLKDSKFRQLYYNFSYQLTDNWLISCDMRIDFPKIGLHVLSKSIKVTYINDCVRIETKFSNNYMIDSRRGIKKLSTLPTISLGLKMLNM